MALVATPVYSIKDSSKELIVINCLFNYILSIAIQNGDGEFVESLDQAFPEKDSLYPFEIVDSLNWYTPIINHRLIIVNNASTSIPVLAFLKEIELLIQDENIDYIKIISLDKNYGTAKAVNTAWAQRHPGEHCVKLDDDVAIYDPYWLNKLEYIADTYMNTYAIGQIGLKNPQIEVNPKHEKIEYRSSLHLWHTHDQPWIPVEMYDTILAPCVLHTDLFLSELGGIVQPGVYGFDDLLNAPRMRVVNLNSYYYLGVDMKHLDPGNSPFQEWKHKYVGEQWAEYEKIYREYQEGTRNPYEPLIDLSKEESEELNNT